MSKVYFPWTSFQCFQRYESKETIPHTFTCLIQIFENGKLIKFLSAFPLEKPSLQLLTI